MIKQPKVICRIKGSYTDSFGCLCTYEYRIFDIDTPATFTHLCQYELKAHPNAKQEVIWEE